jgi:ribosome-associated toxin RatA of RatAB toxin-antitoxin module
MGERVSGTVDLDAPSAVVWDIVTDLAAYPEWTEGVLAIEVLEEDADGYPVRARFRVDARMAEVTYVLDYAYEAGAMRWTLVEGDLIRQLDGSYDIEDTGDGRTRVTYTLEVDVDLPLPGALKRMAARTILDQGLDGLARRVASRP